MMNKISSMHVAVVALVVSVIAIIMCAANCGKSESVKETLMKNPEIVVEAMQSFEKIAAEKQKAEAKKAIVDNLKDIQDANAGVVANPEGEIVLVEFFDFSCGYCKSIAPVLEKIATDNPNVKIIARELTFLGPISQYAAKANLAAKEQGKYAEVHKALITHEGRLSEAKIDELAVLAGVNLEQLKADMNSDKVAQQLAKTNELAGRIKVRGVPTLILNDEVLQTLDPVVIQNAIDAIK